MSQQHHDLARLVYSAPTNRSPNPPRQAHGPFPHARVTLPRQTQRHPDTPPCSSTLYAAGWTGGGCNARATDAMPVPGTMPGGYVLDHGQTWSYVAPAIDNVNRHDALPHNWNEHPESGLPNQTFAGGVNGGRRSPAQTFPGFRPTTSDSDQLIPTVIVIKNIPFDVRKETLAPIMLQMDLPRPYAFNYHFANGVFRGLAFANFQSAEDAGCDIDAMNGMDMHGRKLRVEYKKMLAEAERERIKWEKRERRGQLKEQHRAPTLHQQSSMQSRGVMREPAQQKGTVAGHLGNVDLNDPQVLGFYTELFMFKRDDSREILTFPSPIVPEHRNSIRIIAHQWVSSISQSAKLTLNS
ncbi:hypothetical protein Purlil1_12088 [Purpureocillium lilacinum]|uniref:RRM domain-containing protein n=1 Tax=Purpureocillium lilacinum TaxID=33203 RepID=A0ABR0BHU0_PURLI|nr:hypothetical protein Purlil1_12088 [Purpureocillium lilacinum]